LRFLFLLIIFTPGDYELTIGTQVLNSIWVADSRFPAVSRAIERNTADGRGSQGVASLQGNSFEEQPFHPWRQQLVTRIHGILAIPQLMRQTHMPLLSRMRCLRTKQIRHPNLRLMPRHHAINDRFATAGTNYRQTDLVVLKHPFPLVFPIHSYPCLITADQTITA